MGGRRLHPAQAPVPALPVHGSKSSGRTDSRTRKAGTTDVQTRLVSSSTSRRTASSCDSPASMAPPGNVQYSAPLCRPSGPRIRSRTMSTPPSRTITASARLRSPIKPRCQPQRLSRQLIAAGSRRTPHADVALVSDVISGDLGPLAPCGTSATCPTPPTAEIWCSYGAPLSWLCDASARPERAPRGRGRCLPRRCRRR